MSIVSAVHTDCGTRQQCNGDAFGLFSDLHVYLVADGMGGTRGSTIASTLAIETIRQSLLDDPLSPASSRPAWSLSSHVLMNAVQDAHVKVLETSRQQPGLHGIGTTVAAVAFDCPHRAAVICHVGDTRVYRLRNATLDQLTEDHTVGQQLLRTGHISREDLPRNRYHALLTQAVGVSPELQPEVRVETPETGDVFLICSDGVYRYVSNTEMCDTIQKGNTDLQQACGALVELAAARGSRDDRTVVALLYTPAPRSSGRICAESYGCDFG